VKSKGANMTIPELEKDLETAKEHLNQIVRAYKKDEFLSAQNKVLSIERKLAAERMEEYADPIDFPVQWDVGAPMPHLLSNGNRTFLAFYLQGRSSTGEVALVQFFCCHSVKMGNPNDEVFYGHPLHGKGLEYYSAQIVRNSKWIKELETINKVHPQYNPEIWKSLNHYRGLDQPGMVTSWLRKNVTNQKVDYVLEFVQNRRVGRVRTDYGTDYVLHKKSVTSQMTDYAI
jgi:hypothetical protein